MGWPDQRDGLIRGMARLEGLFFAAGELWDAIQPY